jgi:hypothetical protein
MEPQAIHLGNGAYASIGLGGELVITANDHDPDIATDAVYIEPSRIKDLIEFIKDQF